MNIVADENIPLVREAFEQLGRVETLPGRGIAARHLNAADALLVRSVTHVDEALLSGSKVRFIGSAASGLDHIDSDYLERRNIALATAAGANANSVAEYVAAALLHLSSAHRLDLPSCSLGIVGLGHVGSLVQRKAQALGLRCVVNDPPLARRTHNPLLRAIEEVLECDIVTLHVPLERGGRDPTFHLVNARFLRAMKPGAILINTSRGAVVDETALKQALKNGKLLGAVLDVWQDEPTPDPELITLASIATPHIAGYSFDGKVEGVRRLFQEACRFFGVEASWESGQTASDLRRPISIDAAASDPLGDAVRAIYDIMADDGAMRAIAGLNDKERTERFDRLRKEYTHRREFSSATVALAGPPSGLERALYGLGFRVDRFEAALNRPSGDF